MSETLRHGHAPIPLRLRARNSDIEAAGDFHWEAHGGGAWSLFIGIPDIEIGFVIVRIPVMQAAKIPKHWEWDGDKDKPTLIPSIHTIGTWHGWVHDGHLVEA